MTNTRQNPTNHGQRRERLAFWGFLAVVVLCSLGVWVAEAGAQSTFVDPSAFGSPLWQGAVADEGALDACDGDTADTIHWLVDEAAVAYCPADGSNWEINEFSGGGGGSGTVESVAMTVPTGFTLSGSPITTSGTFALGLSTQAAGRVWAGPASGADAAPGFRNLVATDIPTPLTASTSGNAGTATALAANGANCSAGSAPRGVDASGAAEDCTAYLTDITGQSIGDLNDVDETGAASGEALVSDGAGAWAPSAAAVILEGDSRLADDRDPTAHATSHEDGGSDETAIEGLPTACTIGQVVESDGAGGLVCADAGGGAVSIADLTSGTNTTMAGVIGSGASLAVSGSGTIAATTATSATNAAGIDSDADGTREVWVATVSTHPSVCLGPGDAGTCQARLSNYSGGALYAPFVFGGGLFLGTSADAAESQWWARPLTSTRLQITNMVYATSLEIGHDGTRPYFSLYGAVYYGASATPPTCSTDGSVYTDTTEGSGLAAQCVCLDGTWEVMAGAGGCGTP